MDYTANNKLLLLILPAMAEHMDAFNWCTLQRHERMKVVKAMRTTKDELNDTMIVHLTDKERVHASCILETLQILAWCISEKGLQWTDQTVKMFDPDAISERKFRLSCYSAMTKLNYRDQLSKLASTAKIIKMVVYWLEFACIIETVFTEFSTYLVSVLSDKSFKNFKVKILGAGGVECVAVVKDYAEAVMIKEEYVRKLNHHDYDLGMKHLNSPDPDTATLLSLSTTKL